MKEAEWKCPYSAAYMMKHFAISIMVDAGGESDFQCYGNPATFFDDRFNGQCPGRILWDPESKWVFEPQVGDLVCDGNYAGKALAITDSIVTISCPERYDASLHISLKRDEVWIVMRNNIPFLMPEIR